MEQGNGKTYDKTQQVVENRDGLGNNPGNSPSAQGDANPGTKGQGAVLMHVVGAVATEDADIDVLASNMAKDNTSNDNLSDIRI